MSRTTLIALGSAADGTLFCVASSTRPESRTQTTRILRLDGTTWLPVAEWTGKLVVAAAAVGGHVLCPALDGILYACDLRTGQVRRAALPDEAEEVSACAALDDRTAVMAGGGPTGLLFASADDLAVTRRRLSEFGVSKPGRNVHALANVGGRVYLAGGKGLLAVYDRGDVRELTTRSSFAAGEVLLISVAAVGDDVYVVGFSSSTGHAAYAVRDKVARPIDLPFDPSNRQTPALRNWGDQLLVFGQTVHRGLPGNWSRWGGDFTSGDLAFAVAMPDGDTVCVAQSDGHSFALTRTGATPLALPQ